MMVKSILLLKKGSKCIIVSIFLVLISTAISCGESEKNRAKTSYIRYYQLKRDNLKTTLLTKSKKWSDISLKNEAAREGGFPNFTDLDQFIKDNFTDNENKKMWEEIEPILLEIQELDTKWKMMKED